ncbi:hypothetical protein ACXJY6_14565 [Vibrio sp. RC27]
MAKISVIGTGFIARGFINLLIDHPRHELGKILTRSDVSQREELNNFLPNITDDLDEVIQNSDLVVECSGDAIYACSTIDRILKAAIPVVTMNTEFHVTVGSYFIDKGLVTEAEGDQPGALAILHEEAVSMGFKPVAYSNIKGFLNHNPTLEDMTYWGKKSGISLDMVTSFTDGTKVQLEQTLVGNMYGCTIAKDDLLGPSYDDTLEGGKFLAEEAKKLGQPITDYLLSRTLKPGVFIACEHSAHQQASLSYYKMGDGPYYVLDRPYHLCHMEMFKTVDRVLNGGGVLLDNSKTPTLSTTTIAKRDLKPGDQIKKGIGSFDVRGIVVKIAENPGHVPIGLMADVTIKREIKAGQQITFDDIEIPDSLAVKAWKSIESNVLENS